MLSSRACLWRSIRAVEPSTASSHPHCRNAVSTLVTQQRFLRTPSANIRKVEARPKSLTKIEKLQQTGREPWKRSGQALDQQRQERSELKRAPRDHGEVAAGDMWLGTRGRVPYAEWNARRRELRYLRDPLKITGFVKQELHKGRVNEMLQLVRMASHSMQCVVSWNHIIDYYMAKEQVAEALKVYNEMKKRAQFPDTYTYTILLRGLSINAHHSGVLGKAISVYHSMSAPNSRVQPSIIHTNAVLRVCARALDMDSLWGVVARIPETGPGAADVVTYTTLFNAIRQSLLVDVPKDENDLETAARRERGIVDGRRIWGDVIKKWRNADLIIEEELVCSIGRLLLVGSRPRDWDDVLSLVEQTMDIPRLAPRLGTLARQVGMPHLRAPHTPDEYKHEDDNSRPDLGGPTRGDEFLAVAPQAKGRSNTLTYAAPGNNSLSLIQEACQKVTAFEAAENYWNIITDPTTYGVIPDVNNLNMRLRIMRQNRASGQALQSLQEDFLEKDHVPTPGTFRIVMSTCVRNKDNHKSLKHASKILEIMSSTFPDADSKVVGMYSQLAVKFPLAKGDDLIDALAVLEPIVKNIRLQLGVGAEDRSGTKGARYLKGPAREDALDALRKVYAVYDRLLNSNLIAEERKQAFKVERARLGAFMGRVQYKDHGSGGQAKDVLDGEADLPKEKWIEGQGARFGRQRDRREESYIRGYARENRGGMRDDRGRSSERRGGDRPRYGDRDERDGGRHGRREDRGQRHDRGFEGGGGWRARKALPEEQRRPWFPTLQRDD